jgi:plastocyanin
MTMRRLWSACVLCLVLPGRSPAAEVVVQVDDARGRPAADAVVTLAPEGEPAGANARTAPATKIIDQRDETFVPYVEVFRPGDEVVFRNSDHTRHHAYSFAPAKAFEFVLGPGERSSPMRLEQPGVIAVGCNIHDQMITYFFVSNAPFVAKTGADGRARIGDLRPGAYALEVWHPQLKPGQTRFAQPLTLEHAEDSREVRAVLSLMPDPRLAPDRDKARY